MHSLQPSKFLKHLVNSLWIALFWIQLGLTTTTTQQQREGVVVAVASAWTTVVANGKNHQNRNSIQHPSQNPKQDKILIRTTQATDLPQVASFLATAAVSNNNNNILVDDEGTSASLPWNNWKSKIDQLWAKADIEVLLLNRYQVLHEGRKAQARAQRLLAGVEPIELQQRWTESDRVRLLWAQSSEKFRTLLEKAARDTGEDNVWRSHNVQLPPPSVTWLRHLQLTAVSQNQNQVIGFCEVAVLWNPVEQTYSPAIGNLATAPQYRRRGVATRLLRSASRYVSLYWKDSDNDHHNHHPSTPTPTSLGLFVDKDNPAALALYRKLGFETTVTCDGGDHIGEMWYMTKLLRDNRTTPVLRVCRPSTSHSHQETLAR